MKQQGNLQWFLIKRFIEILAVVGIAEYGITFLMNRFILPNIMLYFFPDYQRNAFVAGTEIIFSLLVMLLLLLMNAFNSIFPSPLHEMIETALERVQNGLHLFSSSYKGDTTIFELSSKHAFLLFLFAFAMTVLILLPYVLGAICFTRITTREFRKVQRQREEELKEFDRKRNLMLSDIAHDLRTPMTTVCGYAKALSDGMVKDSAKQQEYLEAIQNKSVRMNDLINLLFEYVKLDSEGFSLDLKKIDLCELLRENAALIYSDAEEAGMELEIEIPEETAYIMADGIQLSRVITNLLNNAIRHNARNTQIGLFMERGNGLMHVIVADNGSMIEQDMVEHLFEPFAKGDASRKSDGGSGLGLSIVQKVVRMHGWNIEFIQQPNLRRYPHLVKYTKAFVILIGENMDYVVK